jgi:hypothetical protein
MLAFPKSLGLGFAPHAATFESGLDFNGLFPGLNMTSQTQGAPSVIDAIHARIHRNCISRGFRRRIG